MKKATLTIGLFTLVLASTSFATPTVSTSSIDDNTFITAIDGKGGQDSGGGRKQDFTGNESQIATITVYTNIDGKGGQDSGGGRKQD